MSSDGPQTVDKMTVMDINEFIITIWACYKSRLGLGLGILLQFSKFYNRAFGLCLCCDFDSWRKLVMSSPALVYNHSRTVINDTFWDNISEIFFFFSHFQLIVCHFSDYEGRLPSKHDKFLSKSYELWNSS
jgi:hypothetical protein